MLLLLQFLVVGFTVALWWLARRDLTRAAIERHTPVIAEWTELQAAVNSLIVDLERRATMTEQRVSAAEQHLRSLAGLLVAGDMDEARDFPIAAPMGGVIEEAPQDERYSAVYALADSGVTDAREIARRTGLECGEIELILTLRVRRSRA